MPAYTSISFVFKKPVGNNFVQQFYDLFLDEGISFKSVLEWGCRPDLTLNEIVDWNQSKLDSNFIPEDTTDVSHYCRQLCLEVPLFSQCRLILANYEDAISFSCIVPEYEINPQNCDVFEKASVRIWKNMPVSIIDTYGEMGSSPGYDSIQAGVQPSASIFAILDAKCAKTVSDTYFTSYEIDHGFVIKPAPDHKQSVIVSEAIRLIEQLDETAKGEAFAEAYVSDHGLTDAVEQMIEMAMENLDLFSRNDRNQLSYIAYEFGIESSI